jgi:TIR domain
MRMFIE